jgi:hypothetical protein
MKAKRAQILMVLLMILPLGISGQEETQINEQMGLSNMDYAQYMELENRVAMYKALVGSGSHDKAFMSRTENEILALADKVFPKGSEISFAGACALRPTMSVNPLTLGCSRSPLTILLYFSSEDDTMHVNFKQSYLERSAYTPADISNQLFQVRFLQSDPTGSIDRFAGRIRISAFSANYAKVLMKMKARKSKNGLYLNPKGYLMIPIQILEGSIIQTE